MLDELTDLINNMYNSNKHMIQVSLFGKVLPEEKFYLLGFVPADVVGLKKDIWFAALNSEQVESFDQYLPATSF